MLMSSAAMIDQDNPAVLAMKKAQRELKKLKKYDVEGQEKKRREIERLEWEGSLYWDKALGLFIPGINLFACIVEAARKTKAGKRAEAAIVPIEDVKIITAKPYPKDLNKLYAAGEYAFRHPVRIPPKTGARLMKVRPMIPTGWKTEPITIEFDEDELPESDLREAVPTGGRLIGLGGWRPRFGRFDVEWL